MAKILSELELETIENLENYIIENDLKPKDKLPAERELADFFHVSRQTLRKAIQKLCDMGYIKSYQGKGNYIASKKYEIDLERFTNFSAYCTHNCIHMDYRIVSQEKVSEPDSLVNNLNLKGKVKVLLDTSVIAFNDEMIALEKTYYLPENKKHINQDLKTKRIKFSLSRSTDAEARLIGIPSGSVVFFERKIGYYNNVPISCVDSIIDSSRIIFSMTEYTENS